MWNEIYSVRLTTHCMWYDSSNIVWLSVLNILNGRPYGGRLLYPSQSFFFFTFRDKLVLCYNDVNKTSFRPETFIMVLLYHTSLLFIQNLRIAQPSHAFGTISCVVIPCVSFHSHVWSLNTMLCNKLFCRLFSHIHKMILEDLYLCAHSL